jgi:hypothetical protein
VDQAVCFNFDNHCGDAFMQENSIKMAGLKMLPGKRFVDFILPVVAGFLMFGLGCSVQSSMQPALLVGLLFAVPLILFLFLPLVFKLPALSHWAETLPDGLKTAAQWLVLCGYALLLGSGFRVNFQTGNGTENIWALLLNAFLLLALLFFVLYLTRRTWMLYLPLILPWEGRVRLVNLALLVLMLAWGFIFKQSVPALLLTAILVCMGLCLALSLLRLCREKQSTQTYFTEVSGFVFLAFGFIMLLFSIQ